MNKIMQDLSGAYNLVKEYEPLTKEVAEKIIAEGKHIAETVSHDIQMAEKYLAEEAGKLAGTTQTSATETPTPPADPTTAQPTDQGQPAAESSTPAAPADASQVTADPATAIPAAPVADPNATAVVDPNQPQTTTPQVQIQ